jgi:CBS domain-containing protein
MKAKDLMIRISENLRPDMSLKQAADIMRVAKRGEENVRVKALPVVDPAGKLLGMLTMSDILRAVYPAYMNLMNLGDFTWDGMVEEMAKKAADRNVSEVMTHTEVLTVRENDSLMECLDHMIKQCVERVPVVDADGKVVAIVYERDIFYAIAKMMTDNNASEGS